MPEQQNATFSDQGGAATMDPSRLKRWITSMMLRRMSSETRLLRAREREERARKRSGEPHTVEYFHQVDDGYSHLAAQLLRALQRRYDVRLVCHLVEESTGPNLPEPALLQQLSRYDAALIAPRYGLQFPAGSDAPDAELLPRAQGILAVLDDPTFAVEAALVGHALWRGDAAELERLAQRLGEADSAARETRLNSGSERRKILKHYSGGMFYYAGEWYWGIDRLYHLEARLAALGLDREPDMPPLAPRPTIEPPVHVDDGRLTLEIYPSLRSPYTAIVFDRAVALAQDAGVTLAVRPVLPMVMRGVPATLEKGRYIFSDAAREARAAGVKFGNIVDPIGDPVRRAYALYPWACARGKGVALISAFLSAAFAMGINTNSRRGLWQVVKSAGLDSDEARSHLDDRDWEALLEDNRRAMYTAGLWGVPSFRLLDESGAVLLAIWGQDRLWLVAQAIQRHLQAREPAAGEPG